jgi:hypothetical protein
MGTSKTSFHPSPGPRIAKTQKAKSQSNDDKQQGVGVLAIVRTHLDESSVRDDGMSSGPACSKMEEIGRMAERRRCFTECVWQE